MPFLMIHLHIAKNIFTSNRIPIRHLPQFYLGTAAPDAIHNRAGYQSEFKKMSHLCVGDEQWGMISNNDEWERNVVSFLKRNMHSYDSSFLLGYCIHILSDIFNNTEVWTPFKQKYRGDLWEEYGGLYHKESREVDSELALNPQNEDDFWKHLAIAQAKDFFGLLYEKELEQQKNLILNSWYANQRRPDTSQNKVVSKKSAEIFISKATEYVQNKLADIDFGMQ